MIIDEVVFVFRSAITLPENPIARDLLYLNACMWIFDKTEGILVYLTGDGKEASFSLSRRKRFQFQNHQMNALTVNITKSVTLNKRLQNQYQ